MALGSVSSIVLLFNHSTAIFLCFITIILLGYLDLKPETPDEDEDLLPRTNSAVSSHDENLFFSRVKAILYRIDQPKYLFLILMLSCALIYFAVSITVFILAHQTIEDGGRILLLYQMVEYLALLTLYTFAAYVCDTMRRLTKSLQKTTSNRFWHKWILALTRPRMLLLFILVLIAGLVPNLVDHTIILPNVYLRLSINILATPVMTFMTYTVFEQIYALNKIQSATGFTSSLRTLHALYRLALITVTCLFLLALNYWAVIRRLLNETWREDGMAAMIIESQQSTGRKIGVRHFYGVLVSIVCITMLMGENVKVSKAIIYSIIFIIITLL